MRVYRPADEAAVALTPDPSPERERGTAAAEMPEIAEAQALLAALAQTDEVRAEAARRHQVKHKSNTRGVKWKSIDRARADGAPERLAQDDDSRGAVSLGVAAGEGRAAGRRRPRSHFRGAHNRLPVSICMLSTPPLTARSTRTARPIRASTLTLVRTVILGDRWEGDVSISGNSVRIVTDASHAERRPGSVTIDARRP